MTFFKDSDLPSKELLEGVTLRAAFGEKAMITIFNFEEEAIIPRHAHHHEQITYVLKGELEFSLGTEVKTLREGDGVVIPAGVEHGAKIVKGPAKALDAWNPLREDYLP